MVEGWEHFLSENKIISIIDDEIDTTELLNDAICGNIDGITVVTFNDSAIAWNTLKKIKKTMLW